ncbi:hypothetical protein [Chromohalobacter canadensis]|uniref:FUSC family protein n=1 Tax=Chromohalobacter canadensis TaxID=141389 RepID=A0ABZ0Y770_9GAMM|nr:hypothetical protein [Chromohalobacter canadensis]MCK0768979.1 hypothetical protein [Chromohalobacter canadensis]WQH07870.1 hypothetical protein SR908_10265 [Chromohalobacter canadensis]
MPTFTHVVTTVRPFRIVSATQHRYLRYGCASLALALTALAWQSQGTVPALMLTFGLGSALLGDALQRTGPLSERLDAAFGEALTHLGMASAATLGVLFLLR